MPDPDSTDVDAWADYVFLQDNEAGVVREWWCAVPTAFWFIAERNTRTDEILRTYPARELYKSRREFVSRPKDSGA